jgi:hypothetical protein
MLSDDVREPKELYDRYCGFGDRCISLNHRCCRRAAVVVNSAHGEIAVHFWSSGASLERPTTRLGTFC